MDRLTWQFRKKPSEMKMAQMSHSGQMLKKPRCAQYTTQRPACFSLGGSTATHAQPAGPYTPSPPSQLPPLAPSPHLTGEVPMVDEERPRQHHGGHRLRAPCEPANHEEVAAGEGGEGAPVLAGRGAA